MIDQHTLTGESIPQKGPGDEVLASTLVVSGRNRVNVEKAGTDTAVSKISKILGSTADFKTGIQSIGADKAAEPLLAAGGFSLPLVGIDCSEFAPARKGGLPSGLLSRENPGTLWNQAFCFDTMLSVFKPDHESDYQLL